MLRIVLAIAFACACTASAAAADMPKKAAGDPNAYASANTFGGFYIGPSIGYAWSKTSSDIEGGFKIDGDGLAAGGEMGINFQHGQIVVGVAADAHWLNVRGKLTGAVCEGDCGVSGKYDLIGTLRGRIGFTAFGPGTMIYGTGGLAFGRSALELDGTRLGDNKFGWTLGGGVEHMLSTHWTWSVQALYIDFGKNTVATVLPTEDSMWLVTTSLRFKF